MRINLSTLRYDERFAEMCNLLVVKEVPGSKPLEGKGGDLGIDCLKGKIDEPEVVFQHKYYPGRLNSTRRRDIERSLERVSKLRPKAWILCVPIDLTPKERQWFEQLRNEYPSIKLRYWGQTDLVKLLIKYPKIREEFFPQVMEQTVKRIEQKIDRWGREMSQATYLLDRMDLDELKAVREKKVGEVRRIDIAMGELYMGRHGDLDSARQTFIRTYKDAKTQDDERSMLVSITGYIRTFHATPNPPLELLGTCEEAIGIAQKLGDDESEALLKSEYGSIRYRHVLSVMLRNATVVRIHLTLGTLWPIWNEVQAMDAKIVEELETVDSLILGAEKLMVEGGNLRGLAYVLNTKGIMTSLFAFLQRSFFGTDHTKMVDFAKKCFDLELEIYRRLKDDENCAISFNNIALTYFMVGDGENAKKYARKALKIARKTKNKRIQESSSGIMEDIEAKRFPPTLSEGRKAIDITKMTFEQAAAATDEAIRMQMANLEDRDDDVAEAVKIALRDRNPERVLKFCDHIEVEMLSMSLVGQMLLLPSMGPKRISCRHASVFSQGFNLDLVFDGFREDNCKDCPYRTPRSSDWKWTLDWERKHGRKYYLKFF